MKRVLPVSQQSLVQWVSQVTGISTIGVKVRLRGNDLHILCEGLECPQRWRTLSDLLKALQQTDLDRLTSKEQPAIYQVLVYGRKKGEKQPEWCHKVHLNQLDRHLEQVERALLEDGGKASIKPGGALIVSNESLARQGHPEAIARYLSETLSTLGVAVQVKVIKQKPTNQHQKSETRLWIFCESSYSPDPSVIAEPIAQKLRYLKLSGYQDAVIASRVRGEARLNWLMRVDLTPSEVMLKEWARWGDVQALSRLLGEALLASRVAVKATLKETTLHIFCHPASDPLEIAPSPDKALCLEVIKPLLEAIAPQGIIAATVYGQKTVGDREPAWIDWFSLPAKEHSALAPSALEVASTGDEYAIVFLLERLLNPDLDLRLKTGGIRVLLRRKGDLLHIMCDAPVCPTRKQVVSQITQFLSQLKIPEITGVRVYGRRAGNKEPFWHYGLDFEQRQRLVPEATPEFAATSAYVRELLPEETNEPILRPDLTTEEVYTFVVKIADDWTTSVRTFFLGTQLFTVSNPSQRQVTDERGLRTAFVWGVLGLIIALQADWVFSKIVDRFTPTIQSFASASSTSSANASFDNDKSENTAFFASTSGRESSQQKSSAFNASEFTHTSNTQQRNLEAAPLKQKANATAIVLAARSSMPSFNSRQLDEQLALYKQRVLKKGSPPDILIIGSSRALRGIDPVALSRGLASQGYLYTDVFNLGINGATAQVVDFILRQVLEPSELPKLILWADGARAFNSGREDMTFNTIATSPGYKYVLEKVMKKQKHSNIEEAKKSVENNQKINGYEAADKWLNQELSRLSASYGKREKLKNILRQSIKWLPKLSTYTSVETTDSTNAYSEADTSEQALDFDGFLPLSIRFHPSTYYKKHPKVPGNYDNDYNNFLLGDEQDAALQAVLDFTESQKISLVFVNMPLTAEYLDPIRSKYESEFQQYMLRLSDRPSFTYRDLTQLWPKANDYFSDPSHLNRYGAYEVSKKLANDPMIPWSSK
ncbi:MAG: DUF1574 domain-containing protein [Scytonema sp. PMC 1069.18]|nr:DUF1574 domain-containing protein [Scytonema sp. PMC 1069.18]MEC4882942.1 DUF1574 domain-containing protein [Scytonema sp. PMC 1070.18]